MRGLSRRLVMNGLVTAMLVPLTGPSAVSLVHAETPSPRAADAQARLEQKKTLDALFAALQQATRQSEANTIVEEIRRTWDQSGRTDVDHLMTQARAAMEQLNVGLASMLLDEVVELAPEFPEGWNRRARVRAILGERDAALADLDKSLGLEPRHFDALARRCAMHLEAERWSEAREDLRAALAVNPFLAQRHVLQPQIERKLRDNRL